jgi:hypothetical protein
MRQTISGLVAAVAVVTASAVPALACGGGLFSGCSPCGQAYVEPCAAQLYVPPAPVYTGCNTGCGGWGGYERLADPDTQYGYGVAPTQHQYYYVNQGPTYTGPGNFAPYPTYHETAIASVETPVYGYRTHRHYRHWHTHTYRYGYAPRFYASHRHSLRYGMPHRYGYGYREHTLRRYY